MKNFKVSELEILPINLQLFAAADGEDEDFTDAEEGVVDSQDDYDDSSFDSWDGESDDNLEDEDDSDIGVDDEKQEFADTAKKNQSPEENSQFKKMREKAEEQAKKKVESELAEERAKLTAEKQEFEQKQLEKKIMDEHLSEKNVWEKADEEGVSEETAKKMLRLEAEKLIDSEKIRIKQQFDAKESQKRLLQNDKHYKLLEADVEGVLSSRPDLDFQTVYYHMKGLRSEELDKQLAKSTEKRTIANVQDRARRKPLGGSDGGSDASVNPSSVLDRQSIEMSIAFGNDPREIAREVSRKQKENKKRS